MYAIRLPSGNYLEGDFKLSFELNNQVFSTSDASVLPGSFSFPADVPLSDRNKVVLNWPQEVTNAAAWPEFDGVWVECYNVPMFVGTLKVLSCDKKRARITVIANPAANLKEKKLDSLALDGARTWSGDLADHMKDTARLPEDYDYAFFPVFTADIADSGSDSRYQNKFDAITTHEFETGNNAVTPFVRLDYLLRKMFEEVESGYAFINLFQVTTELGRLYVYNNMDARVSLNEAAPVLPDELYLNRHLPPLKCAEWLKKLAAQWCLGLFTNIFSRRISLIPMRVVLARPAAHDWSRYAIGEPTLETPSGAPNVFNYPDQESLAGSPAPQDLQLYNTVAEYANAAAGLPVGYYYVESETCIFHIIAQIPGTTYQEQHYVHRGVHIAPADVPFDGVMGAIFDGQNYCRTQSGISRYKPEDNGFGGTVYKLNKEGYPAALALYRGWQSDIPRSRNHAWDPNSDPATRTHIYTDNVAGDESAVSLMWFGPDGLYERQHKQWNEMLRTGKQVTLELSLPVAELVKFSFEDKVRILNMDYFIKKLRVSRPLGRGLVLVEASMVSTI